MKVDFGSPLYRARVRWVLHGKRACHSSGSENLGPSSQVFTSSLPRNFLSFHSVYKHSSLTNGGIPNRSPFQGVCVATVWADDLLLVLRTITTDGNRKHCNQYISILSVFRNPSLAVNQEALRWCVLGAFLYHLARSAERC